MTAFCSKLTQRTAAWEDDTTTDEDTEPEPTVDELTAAAGLSPFHTNDTFTSMSPYFPSVL